MTYIHDLMQYTEDNNIPELLLMIDFEKAFDTVSWKFIDRTLNAFNFGPSFRRWMDISLSKQHIKLATYQFFFK